MADDYPYVITNGKISSLLEKIQSAAKPEKFNYEFLEKLGFSSSNDRAFVQLMRRLGFLNDSNQPTAYYDLLRDPNQRGFVLAERMRELYSDLFAVNTEINKAPDADIKGAMIRVTGKDETTVDRYFRTFKALASIANFNAVNGRPKIEEQPEPIARPASQALPPMNSSAPSFHYNIQIHLPATTEIAVYNAIFKSLREHLMP